MINPKAFFTSLVSQDIGFFAGVPDSLLKDICAYISDNAEQTKHIIAANEGNALSLGIGYHLASKKIPLIYMQNSGLGNIINPLLSLADKEVYSIPILLLIGWRGEPGVKDEPQHKKQGRITLDLLETMEIPYQVISPDDNNEDGSEKIQKIIRNINETNAPCALVVKKGSFEKYKLRNDINGDFPLFREDAIKKIIGMLEKKDIIVSTTGVASRELFEFRTETTKEHHQDFYTVGGMGHASQIALGIAIQKKDKNVFCLDGDGALLMHMGSLAISASMKCENFKHILFNNGSHDSVGGQPTVGYNINIQDIVKACGYDLVMEANTVKDIESCINKMKSFKGTSFLEIKVKKGFRDNLGRPTTTPIDNKVSIMEFIE